MISLNGSDAAAIRIAAENLSELLEDREYAHDHPGLSADTLERIADLPNAFILTGEDVDPDQALKLLRQVVTTEMEHWVPNKSQRLIDRAARALGFEPLLDPQLAEDCGAAASQHPLILGWVCGLYVARCSTCAHLFKV